MKLLLTSGGITNTTIAEALATLVAKPLKNVKVGFVPTAANYEAGNKDWFVRQLVHLQQFGYEWIDIVDPSAADVSWATRLADADVIFVSGGNTFHLLNQFRKTGFDKWLQTALDHKVYVGASAGSIVATPSIEGSGVEGGDRNSVKLRDLKGLNLANFELLPHIGNGIAVQTAERYAQMTQNVFYAIDDETAIKVDSNKVTVVSEGRWQCFNQRGSDA